MLFVCYNVLCSKMATQHEHRKGEQQNMENRMRNVRKAKGFTQESLARKAHVSRSVIARHETGRTEMSIACLVKIADVLGVKVDDLIRKAG